MGILVLSPVKIFSLIRQYASCFIGAYTDDVYPEMMFLGKIFDTVTMFLLRKKDDYELQIMGC